jgi:hypothetical protein
VKKYRANCRWAPTGKVTISKLAMIQNYSFEELLQSLKKSISTEHHLIFDCDGTLFNGGDVSSITGWLLMKHGLSKSRAYS